MSTVVIAKPAVDSGRGVNFSLIKTLGKVDSARRVTLLPGTTFLHINGPLKFRKQRKLQITAYLTILHAVLESSDEELKVIGCIAK